MKYILATVISLLLYINESFSQLNDSLLVAFRSVNIDKGIKMRLQADVKGLSDITIKDRKNIYHLKKGSYIFVDSIGIEVNDKSKIIALTFLYGYDSNYVHEQVYFHEQKKYRKLLQDEGKIYEYKTDMLSIKVTRWEDKSTIFELIETIKEGKILNYSRIFDKQLYYIQFIKQINLAKSNNSIEILRLLGLL